MIHAVGFVLILGVVLGAFIIFSLIRTKRDALPQRMLIVFWCFMCGIFLHFYGQLHDLYLLRSITFPLINISQVFLPVLVFLYLKSIFYNRPSFFRINAWHLLPTVLYFLFYTVPEFINFFNHPPVFPYTKKVNLTTLTLFKDAYGLIYFILAYRLLKRVEKELRHLYSDFSEQQFSWLNTFVLAFFGVIIIDFIFTLCEFLFDYTVEWDGYISVILIIIAMCYLAYYGIREISLFIPEFISEASKQATLNSNDFKELDKRLKTLLATEKPYLIQNLTLGDLAQKVEIPEKTLSYFLNNFLKVSFYDLINRLRVEEAKRQLQSDALEKYSIAGIGRLCGFSSKSSFYRVFKKETGLTPMAYKKQHEE